MRKRVSIKTISKNKTSKTLLNIFMLTFIMFIVGMSAVYALSYTVSYNNNGGSGSMSNSTFTSNPGTLSTNTFTKSGYKFMGWNKNSGGTSDWYRETNSITGTDGSSTTLYAQWCPNSEGTLKISNTEVKDTYGNYVFRNNKYITVKADNKTITYGGTPSYSYTVTGTLNGEAGVTGSASYTVKDSSNNTVTPSSASVGTYTISVSGLSAATGYNIQTTNTGTLTINKKTCTAPTNVAVSTTGIVTWTASSTASSYQISIDGTTWTNASSGVDYLSTINSTTGSRTVSVRSVCNSTNYNTPSTNATASTTVYSVNLTKGTGISGVTGAGNYISGATVTLGATITSGYTWSKWTETSGGSQVSTAKAYTATISSNWAYTANATPSTYTVTYDDNLFLASSKTQNGVTITYDSNNQYITLNGTTTSNAFSFGTLRNMTLTSGESYKITLSYISGSFSSTASLNTFVLDYQKDGSSYASRTSGTHYKTVGLPSNGTATGTLDYTLTDANGMYLWFWHNSGASTTFTNYKFRVSVTKVHSKTVTYNSTYGTLDTPSKPGFTFDGWYTSVNGGTQITDDSAVSITSDQVLYAHWIAKTYTVTFYYNSNTTSGSTTISTTTATCTVTYNTYCSPTIPTEVTESMGTRNNAYVGVASSTGTMSSSTSVSINGNTNRYAVYRTSVTIYYPTSTSAATNKTVYQNQWFTSTSGMSTTVLSTTTTGTTTNATAGANVSDYSLAGFKNEVNTNAALIATSISTLAQTNSEKKGSRDVYQIEFKEDDVSLACKYQSNTTSGSTTISSADATGTRTTYLRPTSTTAAGTSISEGNLTIPTEVTESMGTRNNAYVGVASSTGTMSTSTLTTGATACYSVYRTSVVIYYPTSTSSVTSKTVYQNQWFTSATGMSTTVLSATTTGTTTNATAGTLVSGYSLVGFSAITSTNTATYATIANLANMNSGGNTSKNVYQIEKKDDPVEATFYYSNSDVGAKTNSKSSGTRTQFLRCKSTTAAETPAPSEVGITPPSTTEPYGTTLVGWATSASTMTTATVNTANTAYYAVYRTNNVRINYYSASAYTTRTDIYRNGVYGTNTNYSMYLATTNTGLSNYATASGPGSSAWGGLSTGADATAEYYNVGTYNTGAAYSSTNTFYTVYRFNVTYEKGSNVSSIGTTDGYGINRCYVSATSTSAGGISCNVTLPSITPNTGYTAVGWSTTKDSTTGTAAGSSYTITTEATKLYGNVKKTTYTITYKRNQSSTDTTSTTGTKTYGVAYSIIDKPSNWSNDTKVFLGWSTAQSAGSSSTWYDPAQSYTTNAALTLYAQWYDVNSLEQSYTTFVQHGDLSTTSFSQTVNAQLGNGSYYEEPIFTIPDGYRSLYGLNSWDTPYAMRAFSMGPRVIRFRHVQTVSNQTFSADLLVIKERTATTYSDAIDTRIDRLQKLQDVSITLNDINVFKKTSDNQSIEKGGAVSINYEPESGYEVIGCGGFNATTASSSGSNLNRVYNSACGKNSSGQAHIEYRAASTSYAAKIAINMYILEEKTKTASTTTFTPSGVKGLARYNALVALDTAKSSYFPNSYVKVKGDNETLGCGTYSAWGGGTSSANLSIPSGKILSASGWRVYDSGGNNGSSFSLVTGSYITSSSATSASINVTHYAGNSTRTQGTGYAQGTVCKSFWVLYISSGDMTTSQ